MGLRGKSSRHIALQLHLVKFKCVQLVGFLGATPLVLYTLLMSSTLRLVSEMRTMHGDATDRAVITVGRSISVFVAMVCWLCHKFCGQLHATVTV